MIVAALIGVFFSGLAAIVFLRNASAFCVLPTDVSTEAFSNQATSGETDGAKRNLPRVSVLIPARNEASGILSSVTAALASRDVHVEVIVLDDHSTDDTFSLVSNLAADLDRQNQSRSIDSQASGDGRSVDLSFPSLRCHRSCTLPERWNGKQHACFQLAELATHDRLLFIDADVRLSPDAIAKLVAYQDATEVSLLSAFPRQETGSWLEKLLIPLMHYVLLCYLPFAQMRKSLKPGFASGCGQLFMTRRSDYQAAGTHRAIAASRHDGIKLPRAYRQVGLATDVVDGSRIATCRMYQNAGQVIRGLLKNATEGIANARLIIPFSVLLICGSVLPWVVLALGAAAGRTVLIWLGLAGVLMGHLPRWVAAKRFGQSMLGVVLHGPAVAIFVALQWVALVQSLVGYQVKWRGRV